MIRRTIDAVVVGGGSAGLAAALRLRETGASVAVVEREPFLGGILLQCIHSGFGLHEFGEDLTGPEYAERFIGPSLSAGIEVYLDTTVMEIREARGSRTVIALSRRTASFGSPPGRGARHGLPRAQRGNVAIAGTRPGRCVHRGLAQRLVNIEGCIPGKNVVIVGSGDIGLIMARSLTLVGCSVRAVIEIQPYPSGSVRNIAQCLNDYSIPLHLGHVVTLIQGRDRVEAVQVAPSWTDTLQPGVPPSLRHGASLRGLIPENELSRRRGAHQPGHIGPVGGCRPHDRACRDLRLRERSARARPGGFRDRGGAPLRGSGGRVPHGEGRLPMLPLIAGANVGCVVPNAFATGRQTSCSCGHSS